MYNDFTYKTYKKILLKFLSGHKNLTFSDFKRPKINYERFFIIRHDIDYCLEKALKMAEIDNSLSIRSTFFLQLSSPYYNLFDDKSYNIINKILSLKHEIGLHYDVNNYETRNKYNLKKEINILSSLISRKVSSISMHNPGINGLKLIKHQNLINAYSNMFKKNINYYSDSAGSWRNSTYDFLTSEIVPKKVQFLFHPIFWDSSKGDRYIRLDNFINAKKKYWVNEKFNIEKLWLNHKGLKEHMKRINKK